MARLLRVVLVALLIAPLAPGLGCKDPGKPNDELKVPDVPPGDRGPGGKGTLDSKGKK